MEKDGPTSHTLRSLSDLPATPLALPGAVIDDVLHVAGPSTEPGNAGLITRLVWRSDAWQSEADDLPRYGEAVWRSGFSVS